MIEWASSLSRFIESSEKTIYTRKELGQLLRDQGPALEIPRSTTTSRLIDVMAREGYLKELEMRREGSRSNRGAIKRYAWGNASPYRIALSLRKGSYLSHSTAMFLHALTDQIPKTLYVNKEQSTKPKSSTGLSQPAIDRAFKSSPRVSKNIFTSDGYRYVLLSGKQTKRLEVSEIRGATGEQLDATKLERTLIDIVVRPSYAGGVYEIIEAYRSAKDRMTVDTLLATLNELDYVYPYHQSIGFLMEHTGYPEFHLRKLRDLGIRWNFYLDYKIEDPAFNEGWRLFHPQGIKPLDLSQ